MISITQQDIQFMVEDITSDLAYMLVEKEHYTIEQAIEVVYKSKTYEALTRPETGLYSQSSGYVYEYLQQELKSLSPHRRCDGAADGDGGSDGGSGISAPQTSHKGCGKIGLL